MIMNEDIKEYLDTLKDIVGKGKSKGTYGISYCRWKILLDYITNLQQENKIYKSRIDKAIEKLKEHKHDLDFEPWSIYKINGSILFELTNILQGSDKE